MLLPQNLHRPCPQGPNCPEGLCPLSLRPRCNVSKKLTVVALVPSTQHIELS